jgi:hypothetical protein
LHWDEHDHRGIRRFLNDAGRLATHAAPDHSRVVFHIRFPKVTDIEVHGWSHEPASRFECVQGDDASLTVAITGPNSSVRFTSLTTVVVDHRTSRAAPIWFVIRCVRRADICLDDGPGRTET